MAADDPIDYGPELLSHLFDLLQIDEEWSEKLDRGFRWWGHRLFQTICADPPERLFGDWTTCLRAETVVVDGYDDEDRAATALAVLNQRSLGQAYYLDPESRTVRAHTCLYWYGGNQFRLPVFAVAGMYQLILAEQVADGLAALVGGEAAVSAHPGSGPRPEPDEMLGLLAGDRVHCDAALPTRAGAFDFNALAEVLRQGYVESDDPEALGVDRFAGGRGLRLTLPLLVTAVGGLVADENLGGGLPAHATLHDATHPEVGSGLLLRLATPVRLDPIAGARLADRLNHDEASRAKGLDVMGAWCSRDGQLWHTSFLSAGAVRQILPDLGDPKGRVSLLHAVFGPHEQRLRLAHLGDICRGYGLYGAGEPAAWDGPGDTADVDDVTRGLRAGVVEGLAAAARDRGWLQAEELLYDLPVAAPVARFGIFNPTGPTLSTLELVATEATGELLLVHKMRHPFLPETWVHALLPAGTTLDAEAMGAALRDVLVERAGAGGPIAGSLPEFVDLDYGGPGVEAHLRACFLAVAERFAAEGAVNLEDDAEDLDRYRYSPWARMSRAEIDAPPPPDRPAGITPAERWWLAVTDPVSVFSHQYHFPEAWDGAIEFLRGDSDSKDS